MRFESLVATVLELDADRVTDDLTPATEATWTSFKHIQLVVSLEEAYGLSFTHQEIMGFRSVGDVRHALLLKGATL